MGLFAVLASGADRPGIVAAVTRVLAETGCNLDDTSMSVLHGHFTMAMVVTGHPSMDQPGELEAALRPVADDLDLSLAVRNIAEGTPTAPEGQRCAVAVYGADRPGIVAAVAEALAADGVNVIDLTTRLVGSDEHPVYAMAMEVAVPDGVDPQAVAARLKAVTDDLGVDGSLHVSDADVL